LFLTEGLRALKDYMSKTKPLNPIKFFVEDGADFRMRPAPHRRQWMDETPDKYAYRCLPLAIANAYGWEILCTEHFEAKWNGGGRNEDIIFATKDGKIPRHATSHFGSGILTFHVSALIQTPPGYDLWVCGPANELKPYIQPLNAVVETDWSPYTFTMNWKFTVPDRVVSFKADEPIATIFPIKRGEIETFEPVLCSPDEDPALWQEFLAWRDSRNNFNADLKKSGSDAQAMKWQKDYMAGPEEDLVPPHRTKIRLKDFKGKS